MNNYKVNQLEVYATIKFDANGHPFYIIADHENMLVSDTMQVGAFTRNYIPNYTRLNSKKAVKDKLHQLIRIGYTVTDKFN